MEEQDVKMKILKGAEELFLRYGLRSVTMDELARHLSVSKKTIYQHFSDKDQIVSAVTEAHLDHDKIVYDNATLESKDAVEELVKVCECMLEDLKDMNPSLLFDLKKYHPNAWNAWLKHKHEFIHQQVVKNLEIGIRDGYFREEINPAILAILRLETIQMGFDGQVFDQSKFNLTEIHMQLLEHFIYGILTVKGRKLYNKYKKTSKANID